MRTGKDEVRRGREGSLERSERAENSRCGGVGFLEVMGVSGGERAGVLPVRRSGVLSVQ